MKTAAIYDIGQPEAARTAEWLEKQNWRILRLKKGQESKCGQLLQEAVDLLIVQIDTEYGGKDGAVGSGHDYEAMLNVVADRVYAANAIVEGCLPALRLGTGKRIAFLTESCGSIRECEDREGFVKHMILAGVHMQAKLLFNRLRKEGFTMRCFAADQICGDDIDAGMLDAGTYFTMGLCYDAKEPYIHSDENRFVMRDYAFREIPW